jgi:hypothetical protein
VTTEAAERRTIGNGLFSIAPEHGVTECVHVREISHSEAQRGWSGCPPPYSVRGAARVGGLLYSVHHRSR